MNEVWAKDEVWGVDHMLLGNTTNGTLTLEHYLLQTRGPKHLSLSIVVPITIVYAAIFISGVIGNVATCAVIITNTNLHTATNYYLFSLAVSDVTLLLLGLPNDLSVFWQQYPWQLGEPLCKLRALVSEMTSYTSVLTIVAFSMERYLAICHPLHSYTMAGLRRAVRIVAVLWVLSFFGALPFSFFTKVNFITFPPGSDKIVEESAFCGLLEENMPQHFPIYELSFFIFFFMPLSVILLLYSLIGLQIRTKTLGKRVVGTIHGKTKKFQSRKSIIRMLAAVVVTFFLCWAPYHAQRLYYFYGRGSEYYYLVNEWLYYIAGCFYYFSATANPLLYNLMSVKYRNGFRRTFCGRRLGEYSPSSTNGKTRRQPSLSKSSVNGEPDRMLLQDTPVHRSDEQESKCCCKTTVMTQSCQWPHTRLCVTIDGASKVIEASSPASIKVQMEAGYC